MSKPKRHRKLFTEKEWTALCEILGLPERQSEVLREISEGADDHEIAARLEITKSTVRSHLARLFAEFAVSNRTQLVIEVFRTFRHDLRS
ncbi:MAG: helix-turn-helix transcriptional regulator [Planctomycetota bacterium]